MFENPILIVLCCLIFISTVMAEKISNNTKVLPAPVCLDGKTVYINQDGQVVLRAPFESALFRHFSDGLAGFVINGKVGFIDEKGRIVIKPDFIGAEDFSEGFASIYVNKKMGFINASGKIVVKPIYDLAWDFSKGFVRVGIADGTDELGLPKYKVGFIDRSGKLVIGKTRAVYVGKFDDARDFSEGVAPVKIGEKWGFVSENDQMVIKPTFKDAKSFSNGLAPATLDGEIWGYIDKTGKFVIKPQFTDADSFSEGLAAVATDKNKVLSFYAGFINKLGNMEIKLPSPSALVKEFHEGRAYYYWKDGKEGPLHSTFIDRTGKIIFQGDDVWLTPFQEGAAAIATGNGVSYIDNMGKYIWNADELFKQNPLKCNQVAASHNSK